MSRIRLRYVQGWVDRQGRVHRYFRRPGYPRVRLPGLPGSAEFNRAYESALGGPQMPIGAVRSKAGSVASCVAAYYGSLEFSALAAATKGRRRGILEKFRAEHGDKPIALLPSRFISTVLSVMKPHAARDWMKALRGLLQFAVALGMRDDDPTQGVKLPKLKTDGFHTWTEREIETFEAHHRVGSRARLAFALLLYTAQRRGDVVRMGRQHLRGGALVVRQEKTGATLTIPLHPELKGILDSTPSNLTFLTTADGRPYTGSNFSDQFRVWCDVANLPKHCSAHGLRKAACRRLAEAGCSANEIAAISGHATLKEVERYTKAVDQEWMAQQAMARVGPRAASAAKKGGAPRARRRTSDEHKLSNSRRV